VARPPVLSKTADPKVPLCAACHSDRVRPRPTRGGIWPRSLRVLYRVRGSLTLVAAARAVHLLSGDPDDPHRRILSPVKMVYGPPPAPLAFRITPDPRLEWETPGRQTAFHSVGGTIAPDLVDFSPEARSALSEACDWVFDFLAAGPRPAREALRAARAAGLSTASLRRAKRILAVRSIKPSVDSAWLWSRHQRPDNEGSQSGGAQT